MAARLSWYRAVPMQPSSSPHKLAGLAATLRSSQLFAMLPAAELQAIAGFVVPVRLAKGGYLFREGESSRGFYLVQSGAINVHRVNAAGKEQVIHVFRAGETLAEASLASPTGYPASARAVEPGVVLLIPKAPMLELIAGNPDLALRMLASMGAHLRVIVGMLDDLTLKDVETRFLNWLVRNSRGATGGVVRLPGTKRVLAAELGTSSETLSRTLARLRDLRLITISGKVITVRDATGLRARLARNLGAG
ncbi:MAG: Crp/Fnr family transcriptional regulator [Opitutaceae bacterium]|nr:Crp/Fnr family transcriptional regulator [Opitutaceae bacterium]